MKRIGGAHMEESDLIRAAQSGDMSAMERLYQAHQVKAYRIATIMLQDPALAGDMVQEAFIRAFREIRKCDPHRPFAPWLARILINCCKTAQHRARRTLPVADVPDQGNLDPGFAAAEARADVWEALQRLELAAREILMLRYFSEFTEPEIATILEIPVGTVKSRLHQARESMKRQMTIRRIPLQPATQKEGLS